MKDALLTTILVILAWTILPTGDPTDIIITAPLIKFLGWPMYMLVAAALIVYLYKTIKGNTLKQKYMNVKREIKGLIG